MREYEYAFFSDKGGRCRNEDYFLSKKLAGASLFAVADGLGGVEDGELASRTAAEALQDYFGEEPLGDLGSAFRYANARVRETQGRLRSGMKTTLAAVLAAEDTIRIAHVGDTRVYVFHAGKIIFQTKDHSVSQMAADMGEITSSEIRQHPDRNILTRALGAADDMQTDLAELPAGSCDALLLCTDGFWEYVRENEMENARKKSRSADVWLYKMRQQQLRRAPEGCDNSTAIAIVCGGENEEESR